MTNMTRQIRVCECVLSRTEVSEFLCLALMVWCVGVFSHDFVIANVIIVLSVLSWLPWTLGALKAKQHSRMLGSEFPDRSREQTRIPYNTGGFITECYPFIPGCYPPIPGWIVATDFLFLFTGRKHSQMLGSKISDSGFGHHTFVNNTLIF